jgi:hypothetical protein
MSANEQRHVSVFPIPLIGHMPHTPFQSRNVQRRHNMRKYIVNASNLVIQSLNSIHSPATYQPFHIPYINNQSTYTTLYKIDYTATHHAFLPYNKNNASQYNYHQPSKIQERMHQHIYNACKRMLHVSHQGSAMYRLSDDTHYNNTQDTNISYHIYHEAIADELSIDPMGSNTSNTSTAAVDLAYTEKASAMPIVANMVSLPSQLTVKPMLSLLNAADTALYAHASGDLLLTPSQYNELLLVLQQQGKSVPKPRLLGNHTQYTALIKRMYEVGMIAFTERPKSVNGLFAVPKSDGSQRIIIDAQPCNLHFHPPPYVALPSPTHLARMHVDGRHTLYMAKMDLSNFYHHIGLPEWMQPYFALPSIHISHVSHTLFQQYGDIVMHPMCTTLPMGFSHSVYIAQHIHNHCLYKHTTLQPEYNILNVQSPYITHPIHMLYIDDNCILGTNRDDVTQQYNACMKAYKGTGFIIKAEKCTPTTSSATEMLGIVIDGQRLTMALNMSKMLKLLGQTLYLIHKQKCTGTTLAKLMGHWTWALMLRRPMFSIVRYSYLFIDKFKGMSHTLWPSVVKELYQLIALSPLLYADLSAPILDILSATDASLLGNGVVLSYTTQGTVNALHPLATYNTKRYVTDDNPNGILQPSAHQAALIANAHYHTIISHRWRHKSSNINELELQSVLSLIKHLVTRPSTQHSTVLHLIDNHSAFSCLRKGRASSVQMIMVLRKITAYLLANDITLLPIWVPSEMNPADSASRLHNNVSHIV